jgi:hypothetical protein
MGARALCHASNVSIVFAFNMKIIMTLTYAIIISSYLKQKVEKFNQCEWKVEYPKVR